jgi:hypothetical protein
MLLLSLNVQSSSTYSICPQSLIISFSFCHLLSMSTIVDIDYFVFVLYILLHSVASVSIPFNSLVECYRLLVRPSERLLV